MQTKKKPRGSILQTTMEPDDVEAQSIKLHTKLMYFKRLDLANTNESVIKT